MHITTEGCWFFQRAIWPRLPTRRSGRRFRGVRERSIRLSDLHSCAAFRRDPGAVPTSKREKKVSKGQNRPEYTPRGRKRAKRGHLGVCFRTEAWVSRHCTEDRWTNSTPEEKQNF